MSEPGASQSTLLNRAWWRTVLLERQLPMLLLIAPLFLVGNPVANVTGVVAVGGLLAARRWATGRAFAAGAPDWALVGLLAMTAIGTLVSPAPILSVAPALGTAYGVVLIYAVLGSVRDARGLCALAGGLVLGTAALVALALVGTDWTDKTLTFLPASIYAHLPQLLGQVATGSFGQTRAGFNPNEVALALGMALPLTLMLALLPRAALAAFTAGSRWRLVFNRAVLLAVAVLGLGIIVLAQSRGTLAALVPAVAALAVARWPAVRRHWRLLGGLAGAAVVVVLLVVVANPVLQTRLLDPTGQGIGSGSRLIIWERSLPMIADFPLTGIGLNTFPAIQPLLYPAVELGDTQWLHAHNLYLQTALDLGLPGLACLLAVLVGLAGCLRATYRANADATYRALAAGAGAGLLVWLANGLVDAPIRLGAKAGLGFWLLCGLLCVLPRLAAPEDGVPRALQGRQG